MTARPIGAALILALLATIAHIPLSTVAQEMPVPAPITYVMTAGSELGYNETIIDVIGLDGGTLIVSVDDEKNQTIVRTLWDSDNGFTIAGPVTIPGDSVNKILVDPEITGTGPVLVLVTWGSSGDNHTISLVDLVNGSLIAEGDLESLAGVSEDIVLSIKRIVYIEGLDLLVVPERLGRAVYAIDLAGMSRAWSASIDAPGFLSHVLAANGSVYLYYTLTLGGTVNVTLVSINASTGDVESVETILESHDKGEGFSILTTGRYTVIVTLYANGTGTIIAHDPDRGTLSKATIELRSLPDFKPSASPDGRYIAAAGMYSSDAGIIYDVVVIDAAGPSVVARLSVESVDRIGWSPDSRLLYVSEERSLYSGVVHVIDITSGAVYGPFNITPANYAVTLGNGTIYIGTTEGRGRDKPTVTVYKIKDQGLGKIAESVVFDVAKEHWLVPLGNDTRGPLYVIMESPTGDFEWVVAAYKLMPAETVIAASIDRLFLYVANPIDPEPFIYSTSIEKQVEGITVRVNMSFALWSGYIIVVYEDDGEWRIIHTYGALLVTRPGEAVINASTSGQAVLSLGVSNSSLWIVEAPPYDRDAMLNILGIYTMNITIDVIPGEARISIPGDVVAVFSVDYYEPEARLFSSPTSVIGNLLSLDLKVYPDQQPGGDDTEEEREQPGGEQAETRDDVGAGSEETEEGTVEEQGGGTSTAVLVAAAVLVVAMGAFLLLRGRR